MVPAELGATIDILDEGVEEPRLEGKRYDVVGITCVTSAAPRAYELADLFRAAGSIVVLGGYHPSLMPEEAAEHADAVVVGPAEEAWPRLLREIAETGRPQERIYRAPVPSMLSMPVPARHLLQAGHYIPFPSVIASRGCTNGCSFCVTHRVWDRSLCARPVAEVVDEIRTLRAKRVIFVDSNLTGDRERAAELFEALIPLRIKWGGSATLDFASDPELLELADRSGCDGVLVGFESVNESSLRAAGKSTNRVAEYERSVAALHRRDILVLGCFVFGFDHDDESIFADTLAFIDRAHVDLPRFSVLTPFPGTRLFDQMKADGRILTEDWSLYDERHAVFQPAHMAPAALEHGMHRAWREAFSAGRIGGRVRRAGTRGGLALAYNLGFRRITPRAGAPV
jgi:radical SAM superfamily enzyme YgiQ (UPF0313 family)